MTKEKLTWPEIQKKYPDQWVALVQVDKGSDGSVSAAVVVASGPDLKVVTKILKKAGCLSDRLEYTGTIKRFLGFAKWDIEDAEHGPPTS